jgi:hypothetical protein
MNSACSSHDEEERGEAGRRKLPGVGVSGVTRWFGRLLKRRRLRWWWPESAVGGRRKSCKGERKAGRRRERAAMAAWWLVGRCVGFLWCSWWRPWSVAGTAERERERERRNCRNRGWRGWFLANFGPDFLLPQTLTSTSIYRRGKRAILSTLRKNFSPWFTWEGSQPLVQSRHDALSNLQLQAAWVGLFEVVPCPFLCQWADEDHT